MKKNYNLLFIKAIFFLLFMGSLATTFAFQNGVVTLSEEYKNDPIKLLNEDKTDYFIVNFKNIRSIPTDFSPFSFHPDYHHLVLIVDKQIDNKTYQVFINDSATKIIKLNVKGLCHQKWEDHILSKVNCLSFSNEKIKFNSKPTEMKNPIILVNNNELFRPLKIENDWLLVETKNSDLPKISGWIKWKNKDQLEVYFYYFE